MLSFWNETLQNISQDPRNDKFIFNVNKSQFDVPLSYALGISPLITEQYLKNPSFKELDIVDKEKIEDEFSNFIRGKEIKGEIFLKIGKLLKNKEMIKLWKKSQKFSKETIIECLKSINEISSNINNDDTNNNNNKKKENEEIITYEDIKEEIEYIGKHLEDMKEDIKKLSIEGLIYIMRNEEIIVNNEDTVWEIIKEGIKELKRKIYNKEEDKMKIKEMRKMRRILLEIVKIKYLSKNNLKEYIEEIEGEDISKSSKEREENIWKQLQDIILNNLTNINTNTNEIKNIKLEEKVIEHKEGKNFEGIIKYLQDKYGKDIHEKGIIKISASSTGYNNPEDVINYEWNNDWYTNKYTNPGEWWEINFKKMKVKMSGYSLKTYNGEKNQYHLKNWVIEGKNEGDEWKEIDRQDNFDLNGPSYQHYYSLSKMTEPYQYIRLKNIGKDHRGYYLNAHYYYIDITNIEIYGGIIEEV